MTEEEEAVRRGELLRAYWSEKGYRPGQRQLVPTAPPRPILEHIHRPAQPEDTFYLQEWTGDTWETHGIADLAAATEWLAADPWRQP